MPAIISRALLDRILACAAVDPHREVCGLLLGSGARILDVRETRNVATDPTSRFEIDPGVLFSAHRAARMGGHQVLGHYHSHPQGPVSPSPCDAEMASEERLFWLICDAQGRHALWRSGSVGLHGRFAEDSLTVTETGVDAGNAACIAGPVTAIGPHTVNAGGPSPQGGAFGMSDGTMGRQSEDALDFAALLCSRLCHDLLSPVGAFNNGLELMADETDPEMRQRCLDLLGESARVSAAKLKFFRLAFGSAGGYGDTIGADEARQAIEGMFASAGRVSVGWMAGDAPLDKRATKVLLNLALIAGDALVRGGQLDIGVESNGDAVEIVVRGQGQKIVLDEELRAALAGQLRDDALSSRTAAAWMTRELVRRAGGEIMLSPPGEPALVFGAVLPR